MKTTKTPVLLALAGLIAMLCASCADDATPGNQRRGGNPSKMQSPQNTTAQERQ